MNVYYYIKRITLFRNFDFILQWLTICILVLYMFISLYIFNLFVNWTFSACELLVWCDFSINQTKKNQFNIFLQICVPLLLYLTHHTFETSTPPPPPSLPLSLFLYHLDITWLRVYFLIFIPPFFFLFLSPSISLSIPVYFLIRLFPSLTLCLLLSERIPFTLFLSCVVRYLPTHLLSHPSHHVQLPILCLPASLLPTTHPRLPQTLLVSGFSCPARRENGPTNLVDLAKVTIPASGLTLLGTRRDPGSSLLIISIIIQLFILPTLHRRYMHDYNAAIS